MKPKEIQTLRGPLRRGSPRVPEGTHHAGEDLDDFNLILHALQENDKSEYLRHHSFHCPPAMVPCKFDSHIICMLNGTLKIDGTSKGQQNTCCLLEGAQSALPHRTRATFQSPFAIVW